MATYEVKMSRPGGGSGTFVVRVHASTGRSPARSRGTESGLQGTVRISPAVLKLT